MTPLPPKQGLKQDIKSFNDVYQLVMTPLPPKQGLKRHHSSSNLLGFTGYDTTSTKTRIETELVFFVYRGVWGL